MGASARLLRACRKDENKFYPMRLTLDQLQFNWGLYT